MRDLQSLNRRKHALNQLRIGAVPRGRREEREKKKDEIILQRKLSKDIDTWVLARLE
jgi:hypothetical protein